MKELTKFGKMDTFKFGSNDLTNPIIIKGNIKTSRIIKCLRSIKKIIIKKILNSINNRDVNVNPK